MASAPDAQQNQQATCVACREPIRPGANTCPHCRSSQLPHKWQVISQTLKWIGGIVTIISLVMGIITLSRYYQDWQERRETVDEIVTAAQWLIKTENYQQAWDMYKQAAEINPSSALVRAGRFDLSLLWVRSFHADIELLDQTLDSITETLYRGLATADAHQTSTILAHVGYLQVIRKFNRLPIFTDVDNLFRQALEANPDNAYANAMFARWMLLERPMTVDRLQQSEQLFLKAMTHTDTRYFVRRLQFSAFTPYSYGYNDKIEVTALTVLLRAGIDMLHNNEALPTSDRLNKILDGYGSMGKAEHVEALLDALPADDHLKVYQWLLAADDDTREIMIKQSNYVIARLHERLGNNETALEYYNELLGTETRKEIAVLVNRGIERLTGKLPARALARNYRSDRIDAENPFAFHLDTLANFDPTAASQNFTEALHFFETRLSANPESLSRLEQALPDYIARVRAVVREGDEIEKKNFYTSGFGSWEHDNARRRWVALGSLYAQMLSREGELEQALAQLDDLNKAINALDDEWLPTQAQLEYELATLYAALTERNSSPGDREQAMQHLLSAIEKGVTDAGLISWQDIKGKRFAALSDDARYQKLIRGR